MLLRVKLLPIAGCQCQLSVPVPVPVSSFQLPVVTSCQSPKSSQKSPSLLCISTTSVSNHNPCRGFHARSNKSAHYDPLEKVEPVGRFEHDEPGLRADHECPNLLKNASEVFELSPHCGTEIQGIQIVRTGRTRGTRLRLTLAVRPDQRWPRRDGISLCRERLPCVPRPGICQHWL